MSIGEILLAGTVTIPLKYKFLSVMLLVLLSALSVFLYVAQQTFSEDKKLFIMDSNRTLLKAATSDIKLELKSRLEELQTFIPRVYMSGSEQLDPFQGLSPTLVEELIGVTFFRRTDEQNFTVLKEFTNQTFVEKQKLTPDILKRINEVSPVSLRNIDKTQGVDLVNRSMHFKGPNGVATDLPILTFVLGANFMNDSSKELFIVVDFSQKFLMRVLAQSELTEIFLLFDKGSVLSHPNVKSTVAYARSAFPHPIVEKLKEKKFTRESLELEVDGEEYLCNMSETGFKNVFAISQIRKAEAFLAIKTLIEKSFLLALIILAASTVFSIFFASGLTTNIQKLRFAAEQLGAGNLNIKLAVRSNDEIQSVARSFQWMANQIKSLIEESTEKARLEDELETARLVQSTLLTPPNVQSNAIEMDSHYVAATECGGDYWDARITGNLVTVFIGDATGHGAPAAIVTAVAKSCFATLSSVHADAALPPEQLLSEMNKIIYSACRGKLLMTMCIVQLNLETGELLFANAGHESPMCLRAGSVKLEDESSDKKRKAKVDILFSRGERLGFSPEATYTVERDQLEVGDTVLLYTDGISEAKSEEGKDFGERALKKSFGGGEGLPLGRIKLKITQEVDEHIAGAVQEDDITFVLFRWNQRAAPVQAVTPKARPAEPVGLVNGTEDAPAVSAPAVAVTKSPPPKQPPGGFKPAAKKATPPPPPKPEDFESDAQAEMRDALLAGAPEPQEEEEQDAPAKPLPSKPKAA